MSVEALAISSIVEEGISALRTFYANGISANDFLIYDSEFEWCERRLTSRRVLNRRVFRQRFPEFEWSVPTESTKELALTLKEERAFEEVNSLVASLSEQLEKDNAIELAQAARERLSQITRQFAPMSNSVLEDWRDDVEEMKRYMKLAKAGAPVGLNTGLLHLDHHLGGILPGQVIQFLGRTGEGKSYITTLIALHAKLQGAKVGVFTPEMSRHEVKCRLHTLASARKEIQEACHLERSFRNRALLHRRGFNVKSYASFCQYFDEELPGRIHLLSGTHRQEKMSVGYIEDQIAELGLDYVIIDPIYLLKPVRRYKDNEQAEIGTTSYAVAALAEQYNIPITITNQSNRQGGAQGDAPHKDRSYNSDVPNHVVDYVIGIKHISDENRMIVRCSKSRFGASDFRFELAFYCNTGVIREMTPLSGSYFNGKDSEVDDDTIREVIKGTGRSRGQHV